MGSRSLMTLLVTSKSFFSGVLGASAMSALTWQFAATRVNHFEDYVYRALRDVVQRRAPPIGDAVSTDAGPIRGAPEYGVVAFPIPPHELKRDTWYYGVRCACSMQHALCEDLFRGKGTEQHLDCAEPVEVACDCGALTRARRLHKFKTP